MEDGRRARLRRRRRDRRALHERGQPARRWPTRRPRCRVIAAAPARSAMPRSICSTAAGAPTGAARAGDDAGRARRLSRRAAGCAGRCSRSAIVDVDTGLVSRPRRRDRATCPRRSTGDGAIECRFDAPAAAAAAVRAAAVDHRHPSAGVLRRRHGRPALRGQRPRQRRREPGRRGRRSGVAAVRVRASRRRRGRVHARDATPRPCSCRSRTAAPPATCCERAWSAACSMRASSLRGRAAYRRW